MSQLAKEIAEALEEGFEEECFVFYDGQHFTDAGLETFNKIIAAKLKPVRKLFEKISKVPIHPEGDPTFADLAKEGIALLSKETK